MAAECAPRDPPSLPGCIKADATTAQVLHPLGCSVGDVSPAVPIQHHLGPQLCPDTRGPCGLQVGLAFLGLFGLGPFWDRSHQMEERGVGRNDLSHLRM